MVQVHSLIKEFPQFSDKIHSMKLQDNHFRRLFDSYDALEHEIRKIEDNSVNTSDFYLEDLKKKRIALKDELFGMLSKAA